MRPVCRWVRPFEKKEACKEGAKKEQQKPKKKKELVDDDSYDAPAKEEPVKEAVEAPKEAAEPAKEAKPAEEPKA